VEEITAEDYASWREGIVTKHFIKRVKNIIREKEELMGGGRTLVSENSDETQAKTAYMYGLIDGLKVLDDLTL